MLRRVCVRTNDLIARWRHAATAADRGWKATVIGVAIVLVTVFVG